MRMRRLAAVLLMAVLAASCDDGGGGGGSSGTSMVTESAALVIQNDTMSYDIVELYAVPETSPTWGTDHLAGDIIAPGAQDGVMLLVRDPYPEGGTPGPVIYYNALIVYNDGWTEVAVGITVPYVWTVTE